MEAFYVSRQGYQEGPHSLELIEDKIKSGYFSPNDYIYDAAGNEWVLLSRFKDTKETCKHLTKKDEITESLHVGPPENTWYLLRGDNQSGPYEYQEIAGMLQDKKAYEYDYVWSPSMTAWERVSECSFFQADKLKPFLKASKALDSKHFRRKSARVEHGASLVFHNHKKLWNGTSFELSAGGASIEVEDKPFIQGEVIIVHYRPSKRVPAFNVHCEVVSCQGTKGPSGNEKYRIGLRFIKVNSVAQKVIRELVAQNAA